MSDDAKLVIEFDDQSHQQNIPQGSYSSYFASQGTSTAATASNANPNSPPHVPTNASPSYFAQLGNAYKNSLLVNQQGVATVPNTQPNSPQNAPNPSPNASSGFFAQLGNTYKQHLQQQLIGSLGSGIAAGVGAATGSASLGALAGIGGGAVGTALAALGPVGIALGAVAIGATAVIEAFNTVADAAQNAANRLAPYSAALSVQEAQNEVTNIRADIRRAQAYGPDLAKFSEAQNRLDNSIEDFKLKLLSKLLPFLVAATDFLTDLVDSQGKTAIAGGVLSSFFGVGGIAFSVAKAIEIFCGDEKKKENEANLDDIFKEWDRFLTPVVSRQGANDLISFQKKGGKR